MNENVVDRVAMVLGVVACAVVFAGCVSGGSMREKVQKEYNRLVALPPAERVHAQDKAIDDLGGLSQDSFNEMHRVMKAYVTASENHREYVGFMNDVQCCVQEEKLSNEDACKKVSDAVVAEDANRSADQKVWPRIVEGINAANELAPEKLLKDLAVMTVRNTELSDSANKLKDSFKGFDTTSLQKASAVGKISDQLKDTAECLAFLTEQFRRVQVLKYYKK